MSAEARKIWEEKLEFLLKEEALEVVGDRKFKLKHDIAEAREKIDELRKAEAHKRIFGGDSITVVNSDDGSPSPRPVIVLTPQQMMTLFGVCTGIGIILCFTSIVAAVIVLSLAVAILVFFLLGRQSGITQSLWGQVTGASAAFGLAMVTGLHFEKFLPPPPNPPVTFGQELRQAQGVRMIGSGPAGGGFARAMRLETYYSVAGSAVRPEAILRRLRLRYDTEKQELATEGEAQPPKGASPVHGFKIIFEPGHDARAGILEWSLEGGKQTGQKAIPAQAPDGGLNLLPDEFTLKTSPGRSESFNFYLETRTPGICTVSIDFEVEIPGQPPCQHTYGPFRLIR